MNNELVFENSEWSSGYYGGYDGLIQSCSGVAEVVRQWNVGSYQGDEVYLLKNFNGRYGWVVQGYGSCSGCDALQACDTRQEVESLRDGICNSILWFNSIQEVYAYITDQETNQWYWYEAEWKDIVEDVRKLSEEEKVAA